MTTTGTALRIGDVARLVGTTSRTIRYYEEIGLLPPGGDRESGRHRVYDAADVERLKELLRLRDLLGTSLDELRELVEAEDVRAELRAEFHRTDDSARRREILLEADVLIERQLALVHHRSEELQRLEEELRTKQGRVHDRLAAIDASRDPD